MVSLLDPREGELICDPAAGSGGFLIRAFEHVRGRITSAIQADKARAELEAKGLEPEDEEAQIDQAFAALNRELLAADDENRPVDTRMGRLAWRCIFGCDAEPRAARTAKMNMIMHGDGHGGIHYHDGLVDINGIFPTRFRASRQGERDKRAKENHCRSVCRSSSSTSTVERTASHRR